MSLGDANLVEGYRAPSVHTESSEKCDDLHTLTDDIYQELLIPGVVTNDQDIPMPDPPQELARDELSNKDAPNIIKEEESESEFLWARMQEHTIELADSGSDPDSEDEIVIKKEPKEGPIIINDDGERVIEILDSEDEGFVVPVKQEPVEPRFDWKDMPTTTIELSDAEDDVVVLEGGTKPPINQEESDVPFLWSDMGNRGVIELPDIEEEDTNAQQLPPTLGNSFLRRSNLKNRRTAADPERMRQMQRLCAARALQGRRTAGGASSMFHVPQPSTAGNASQGLFNSDSNAWMRYAPREFDDPGSNFAEIKRQYKAKRKAKTNTMHDDIAFRKAQDAEKVRIRKLEARMYQMDSSEEEVEESEDNLFVPDSTPPPPSSKRANAEGGKAEGDDEGRPGKGSRSKKQKITDKPKRTKAELRSELYHNLMAGYEEEDAKDKRKEEYDAMRADKMDKQDDRRKQKAQKDPNAKHTHELMKGKKPGKKSKARPKPRTKKKSVRNFRTTNIYDESNANLTKLTMPAMHGKEKHKAMTDLIASIPLEESKKAQATSDRASILKATTVLGNCRVNEDHAQGEGDWNLRGMKTPLFHHQVQGAARMKERETGEKLPLGGVLADEMGFGKTLMSIATMIANPPAPTEEQRCTLIICSPAIISQWDDEINKHTRSGVLGSIIRHHGHTRISSKGASGRDAIAMMETAGVVLSTYSEVIKSYPKCAIPERLTRPVEKMAWWKEEWERKRNLLHRVQFYRVILDGEC